jgi:hypothetical protein
MSTAEQALLGLVAEQVPDLTEAEKKLLRAAADGSIADYSSPNDAENDPRMPPTGVHRGHPEPQLSAGCVPIVKPSAVSILRGFASRLPRLRGGSTFATVPVALDSERCAVPNGAKLVYANTRTLWFEGGVSWCIREPSIRI